MISVQNYFFKKR